MRLRRYLSRPRVRRTAWIVGHVLFVVAAVVMLGLVNRTLGLPAALVSPLPELHRVWLPTLFLIAYAAAWLAWAFIRLTSDSVNADPDLLQAWEQIHADLDRSGLDLQRLPVILVLGRSINGVGDFFAATGLPFALRAAHGPLDVYATREAIVLAVGVGSLAELRHEPTSRPVPGQISASPTVLLDLLDGAPPAEDPLPPPPDASDFLPPLPTITNAVGLMSKQLADVARLLARDRRPYCPANGLVWLLPASALDGNRAESTAAAIRADRRALDSVWQLDLPQTVCIVNAETVPGFRELAGSIPASARAERSLGVTFPARPATSQVQAITDHIAWLTNGLVAGLAVHRLGGDDFMAARAAWRCAAWWAERGPRLSRLVTDGLPDADGRAALVTGVHLCATGADSSDHAFAAAPLIAALAREDIVAWSPAARRQDHGARLLAAFVWGVAVVALIVLVWLALNSANFT